MKRSVDRRDQRVARPAPSRVWIGSVFVAAAAVVLATIPGSSSSGRTGNPTARDGGRLIWEVPGDPEAGRLLDLCRNHQAVRAGLDGGALDRERAARGLACDGSRLDRDRRWVVLDYTGQPRPVPDPHGPRALTARDRTALAAPPTAARRPLGSLYHAAVRYDRAARRTTTLTVMTRSVTAGHGTLQGLVANGTSGFQDRVRVTARTRTGTVLGSATVPFTVQSGELAPFTIDTAHRHIDLDRLQWRVTGRTVAAAPVDRSVAFADMPGWWSGPVKQFPGVAGERATLPDTGRVRYYQSMVQVERPRGVALHSITSPKVMAAFLDPRGRVVDVRRLTVWAGDTQQPVGVDVLGVGDVGVVGALAPRGAVDLALWAYGEES